MDPAYKKMMLKSSCENCGKTLAKHAKNLRCPFGKEIILKSPSYGVRRGRKGYEGYLIGQFFVPRARFRESYENMRIWASPADNFIKLFNTKGEEVISIPYDEKIVVARIGKLKFYARVHIKKRPVMSLKDLKIRDRKIVMWEGWYDGK